MPPNMAEDDTRAQLAMLAALPAVREDALRGSHRIVEAAALSAPPYAARRSRLAKVSALGVLLAASACGDAHLDPRTRERALRFELEAELPASQGVDEQAATIWLPVPVAEDFQECGRLQARALGGDAREAYDALGNRILSVRGVPPLRLAYTITVRRFEARRPLEDQESGEMPKGTPWLRSPRRAPAKSVERETIVWTAEEPTTIGRARIFFDRVIDKLNPGPTRSGDLARVLATRSGAAGDYATLFNAYCRSLGVPATFECGFALPKEASKDWQTLGSTAAWSRFFVPGMGWLAVDCYAADRMPALRESYFAGLDQHRIRLSRGRDLVLEPRIAAEPLDRFAAPYAEQNLRDVSKRLRVKARFVDL